MNKFCDNCASPEQEKIKLCLFRGFVFDKKSSKTKSWSKRFFCILAIKLPYHLLTNCNCCQIALAFEQGKKFLQGIWWCIWYTYWEQIQSLFSFANFQRITLFRSSMIYIFAIVRFLLAREDAVWDKGEGGELPGRDGQVWEKLYLAFCKAYMAYMAYMAYVAYVAYMPYVAFHCHENALIIYFILCDGQAPRPPPGLASASLDWRLCQYSGNFQPSPYLGNVH